MWQKTLQAKNGIVNRQNCPVCGQQARQAYPHPDGWIFRCPQCTHAFTDPSSPYLESYNEAYFAEAHRNWFRNPNTALFSRLQSMLSTKYAQEGLLDVGCGRGDFLFYLERSGTIFPLAGIDIAPLPSHPRIHFVSQDLFSWEPNQTFGVVTSLAVIEHVPDIRGFLRKLRRFAKKGGRLVLMTLNECSTVYAVAKVLRRFDFKGPFERLYSRHHRHHFTLRSLRYLVEQTGLVVEEHFTHNFPLAAVDFPSRGPWLDATQKVGVAGLFSIGRIAQNAFLQTLVCRT